MKYRRWSFGLAVEINPDICRVCGKDPDDGRHMSIPECSGYMGRACDKPHEHHDFRPRRVPLRVERVATW